MMHARRQGIIQKQDVTATDVDWESVYREYLPHVYNYFRFRTGDMTVAEDLTAQTFEQVWRSRARYRADRGALSTWLFTIARNVAASHFRRQRSKKEFPLTWASTQPDQHTLEDIVEHQQDLARLQVLLARLPAREREVIELKYGAALTNRAIAQLTGLQESHVGTLL